MTLNFHRHRKTGPDFPLAVAFCKTHGHSFTLYPFGYVPYGRCAVITVSYRGDTSFVHDYDSSDRCDCLFEGTMFQAGLDAARGHAWQREGDGVTEKLWPTQVRTLAKLTRLLGVDPSLEEHCREKIVASLDLDLLFVHDCARIIEAKPGYRSRGKAIKRVLDEVIKKPCILDRLLLSGHVAGLWGLAFRWDVQTGSLRSSPFRRSFSRDPPQ